MPDHMIAERSVAGRDHDVPLFDADYTLLDRYEREGGRIFLTGTQALVRILVDQRRADLEQGIRTAGLVSGYRGSPLGGVDQELWRQKALLANHDIRFEPGLNEDLGATMLWGAQQIAAFPGQRVQGVFGLWYGKGPGVDRTGDVFRNANTLGTSRYGGVLAVAGDDHGAQSSMIPHQTDQVFEAAMIPVLYPASVAEYVEFGLYGYAMSRYSGLWAAFKAITETVESGRSVALAPRRRFVDPTDFMPPPHGLNYDPRLLHPAQRQELERRVVEERLPALQAFMRANPIDRVVARPEPGRARLGIVTVGKSHLDLLAALPRLGLTLEGLRALGIGVYKVGVSWPIEGEGVRRFAEGLQGLLVIEEKRSLVEAQIKDVLFNLPADRRPAIEGKRDRYGAPLIPATLELSPEQLAGIVASFAGRFGVELGSRTPGPPPASPAPAAPDLLSRRPFFCSGCPHNTSTRVPAGSFAAGGIGCHIMALGTRSTETFCQMGGEGIQWVGLSTFTDMPHLFVNLGDGTYQHSGSLAIRQAVAAGTTVTYKILYNDAVAMTGGQPVEGQLTVRDIVAQVSAEGVRHVAVVADDPGRHRGTASLPDGVELHHRDALEAVQRDFRTRKGVSVIVYDQTCAAEKRRRRKRKEHPDPPERVLINPAVCEGCGDCSVQSNCISVEPLDTELGRKRRINQSACNKDYSCLKGFCPSFVSVTGVTPRKPDTSRAAEAETRLAAALRRPDRPALGEDRPFRVLVTGIGGTGVVTIGSILSMAAHLDGLEASTLDFTGVAQKNGAVISHVQIADRGAPISAVRIGEADCDLMLGCDIVVAASAAVKPRLARTRTAAVVNRDITPTADFVTQGDRPIAGDAHERAVRASIAPANLFFVDATRIATEIFGDAIATNLFLVGFAYQRGLLPLREAAIDRAIALNGAAVTMNRRAFLWGRIAADDPGAIERVIRERQADTTPAAFDFDTFKAARLRDLTAYQDGRLAQRYADLVERVRAADARAGVGGRLAEAAARSYYKLLAYKDEYEVARLHLATLGDEVRGAFDGTPRVVFHMAPPLVSRIDPATGRRRKRALAGWYMEPLLRLLRHGRHLRGTVFDPFGYQGDRRIERALIGAYEEDVDLVLRRLSADRVDAAAELLALPQTIRGYGPVKEESARKAVATRERLRDALLAPVPPARSAAA